MKIYPENCIDKEQKIESEAVDLGIFDPPFGINESGFDKHYKRNNENVIDGYEEAPANYGEWTIDWLSEAVRVLRPNGSMYIVIGHSNLRHVLNAAHELGLNLINHIIWKYNFGVYTKRKYVTAHYHVLYYGKSKNVTFNQNCRFGSQERTVEEGSFLYHDLEDVFVINKDYFPGEIKNQNKLPEELIRKLILYSSNPDDMVCDFFMGNFTTAYMALRLGRNVCGYEINKESYNYHIDKLKEIEFGSELRDLKKVDNVVPLNQGKKITIDEIKAICNDYIRMNTRGINKKRI